MEETNNSLTSLHERVSRLEEKVQELQNIFPADSDFDDLDYDGQEDFRKLTVKQIALLLYFKGFIDKSTSDTSELARLFSPLLNQSYKNLYDAFRKAGSKESLKIDNLNAVLRFSKENRVKSVQEKVEMLLRALDK